MGLSAKCPFAHRREYQLVSSALPNCQQHMMVYIHFLEWRFALKVYSTRYLQKENYHAEYWDDVEAECQHQHCRIPPELVRHQEEFEDADWLIAMNVLFHLLVEIWLAMKIDLKFWTLKKTLWSRKFHKWFWSTNFNISIASRSMQNLVQWWKLTRYNWCERLLNKLEIRARNDPFDSDYHAQLVVVLTKIL